MTSRDKIEKAVRSPPNWATWNVGPTVNECYTRTYIYSRDRKQWTDGEETAQWTAIYIYICN